MKAEYPESWNCPQKDSAEHEEYVGVQSVGGQEVAEQDGADLLERILSRDNLNKAYKRVRANKGAPGIDGMTIEDALPWLREHREELLESIRQGKYKPQPVRRKEIPKTDGGIRKLGIPTVIDRIIQQAIAQHLVPIYEPLFSDDSYGYRPNRSAQQAIQKVKWYAEQGYTSAVLVDLSKYFDTLNHELLMNLLRKNIHDKRVIELIKRYLKAGVMENGLLVKTTEGSPQGGPLSPLLANIYLNEYDKEMAGRGVPVIRYADDIVVMAKSPRAAQRLLESTQRYLEGKLKLKMNVEKSKVVSVYSIRKFKFLGFALGKGKNGVYIRVHAKSMKKAKAKLKELTSRSQGRNVRKVMENVKVYIRGWLGYFGIASMKTTMQEWDKWLRRRIRMYIWKQWKIPKTRIKNLVLLGIPEWAAYSYGNSRKGYWRLAGTTTLARAISNKRLVLAGYYSILDRYTRQLKAAAALLLCVVLSGAMLFSRLVEYSMEDPRQYIPLTESNGITTVFATQQDTGLSWKSGGFAPNRPVLLAASPFLTANWFRVTDENTVWKGDTRVEIFRVSYKNGQQQVTVKSGQGDKIIAPGTENSYTFALENTADGPVEYSLFMKAYISADGYNIPVEAKVSRDTDKKYLLGSATSYADVMELNKVSDSGTLKKGYVMPYTLSWQWPFEGDDAYDTMLGNLEEDLTLTIVIETTASYAPPTADGGIPKTGDTSHIGMWFTVMLGSAAGLMFLLLLMRRKGEENETA